MIEKVQSPDYKGFLRRQTEEAMILGIFGAPTFVVGEELFWGNVRLGDAIDFYRTRFDG